MTNASTELATLWELLGKGTHQAWPEWVYLEESGPLPRHYVAILRLWGGDESQIDSDLARTIVRYSVEGWLAGRGWSIERTGRGTCYTPNDYTLRFHTLADAVRYALESTPA